MDHSAPDLNGDRVPPDERYDSRPPLWHALLAAFIAALAAIVLLTLFNHLFDG